MYVMLLFSEPLIQCLVVYGYDGVVLEVTESSQVVSVMLF